MGRFFFFSETFQRLLFYSKSSEELKVHSVFVIELMVVSALLTGAAIGLWSVLPIDFVSTAFYSRDLDLDNEDDGPRVSFSSFVSSST